MIAAPELIKTTIAASFAGAMALVPYHVARSATPGDLILDYRAGLNALHTMHLRKMGLDVVAYEVGDNFRPGTHRADALRWKYDIVYASNVLNRQDSIDELHAALTDCRNAVAKDGLFFCDLPESPRRLSTLTEGILGAYLRLYFSVATRVGGTTAAPVLRCVL